MSTVVLAEIISERIRADVDAADLELATYLIVEHHLKGETLSAVDDAVAAGREAFAPLFRKSTPVTSKPVTSVSPHETLTERVAREARQSSSARAIGEPNPWAKGSVNITMQVMMEARDPSRAARLKAEAGR